jgi:hypothetical protein
MFYGLDLEGSPEVPVNSKNSTPFYGSLWEAPEDGVS